MIDEKKLIIWIKCHCNPYGKPDFDYDTSMKIIDFIENYQTKVGEWIPCSERLPELHKQDLDSEGEYFMISDHVIVTDGENVSVSQYEIDDVEDNGWLYNGCLEDADVLAWMPLPEPYRSNGDTVKQTNADRIRNMTDEELADFIEMKQFFAIARNGTDGEEYTLQWLKSEVEGKKDD